MKVKSHKHIHTHTCAYLHTSPTIPYHPPAPRLIDPSHLLFLDVSHDSPLYFGCSPSLSRSSRLPEKSPQNYSREGRFWPCTPVQTTFSWARLTISLLAPSQGSWGPRQLLVVPPTTLISYPYPNLSSRVHPHPGEGLGAFLETKTTRSPLVNPVTPLPFSIRLRPLIDPVHPLQTSRPVPSRHLPPYINLSPISSLCLGCPKRGT